ncbi:MAG: TatD family hydrolase [Sorangiineae bacterium]|nr:TatD family hydrolase [Polyangiaceae bacterium]MEB2324813.1 TatD family hydrolase [Sorangiineae bacterium]
MLVDTHCHLDPDNASEGPGPILERARAAGVGAFVCVGVGGVEPARHAVALAQRRADVVAAVGVHPHDAASWDDALEDALRRLCSEPRVVAVGEVGLDYHYEHSPREVQRAVFRRFIALARELGRPLVIHTRSAAADTLALLEQERARDVGGVIHCFSENREFARRALELGFDLSFSGIVTFKNATAIHEVARWVPEDRFLVETDSPYLAPVPLRGKRCEPAYVVHTAARVAALRGVSLERVAALSTTNACRRFGAPLAEAVGLAQTPS